MRGGLPADERDACHAVIRRHARSFYLASRLLPGDVGQGAHALYAFCREADDTVDVPGCKGAWERLAAMRRRLDAVYGETAPEAPVDRAFQRVARTAGLPRSLPEALLDGLATDCGGGGFETERDLTRYAFHVASTVGLMMTLLMGVRRPEALRCAAHLGAAMQLTNIARDVGEDARRGRIYLPRALCAEVGLDPASLAAAECASPACREAVRRLLARADAHYRAAEAGIALLPPACRPAIAASRYLYADIGRSLARRGHEAIAQRASVSTGRKLALLAVAAWRAAVPARPVAGPAEEDLAAMIAEVGL